MKSPTKSRSTKIQMLKQRGVVLFFALIALLAMSLAAVALIRSVDTGTIIAGNLALKQSATTSSGAGIEAAMTWLRTTSLANSGIEAYTNAAHPFNNNDPASGYYATYDPSLNLTDGSGIQWVPADSNAANPDGSDNAILDAGGNEVRYIIQRMCRTAGVAMNDPSAGCLISATANDDYEKGILDAPGYYVPPVVQSPQIRITVQTRGPRNTVSYVQAFVY